jgi:hypothetical protein
VDAIPLLQGKRGRPRRRPDCVLGDRGYDAESIREGLRARHIVPLLARRNTEHGSGLGRSRWVVERTFAWLNLKDGSTSMPPEYRKIVDEIYIALQNLNAPPLLLGIIGSWGDTLTDEEVLAALKSWNSGVRQPA